MGLLLEHLWITRLSWKLEIVIILQLFIRCRDLEATGDIRSICHVLGANQFCQYVILHTQNQQCNDKVFYQWLIWTSSYSWESNGRWSREWKPPQGSKFENQVATKEIKTTCWVSETLTDHSANSSCNNKEPASPDPLLPSCLHQWINYLPLFPECYTSPPQHTPHLCSEHSQAGMLPKATSHHVMDIESLSSHLCPGKLKLLAWTQAPQVK